MAEWRQDPEGVRTAIIAAATRLFSEHGFARTSLQQVARDAGVTKSLISHHFGNKQALFESVRGAMFRDYFEAQRLLILSKARDVDVIAESIRTYFNFLKRNLEIVRMCAWMNLEDVGTFEDHSEGLTEFGVQRIERAQADGVIRRDVKAFYILTTMWSMAEHWFLSRRDYVKRMYGEVDMDQADADYLETIVAIMLEGISPRDGGDQG